MDLEAPIPEDEEITAMFRAKPKSPTAAEVSDAAQGASGGDAQIVAADPTQMYEDMSGVDDEDDGVEVTQANGGVTIAVEKLSDEDKNTVQAEIDAFKKVREGGNAEAIKTAMQEMTQKVYAIFGKLYQQEGAAPDMGAQGGYQPGADGAYDAE